MTKEEFKRTYNYCDALDYIEGKVICGIYDFEIQDPCDHCTGCRLYNKGGLGKYVVKKVQ